MKRSMMKSTVVFVVVMVALGVSGSWLHNGGWLQMPRIFDVPAVLGGDQAEMGHGPMGVEGERPAGERPAEATMQPGGEGFKPGGEHANGLNWDLLPGVLSNLWIIALIITVVFYSAKGWTAVVKRISFRRTAAAANA